MGWPETRLTRQLASHHAQQGLGMPGVHQTWGKQAVWEPWPSSGTPGSQPGEELEGGGGGRGVLHCLLERVGREQEGRETQGETRR